MAGGVPAGRLSIEIVAEIARLQQDLDKAKRMVRDASGDIAKSTKAANDNLGGVGKGARLAGHQLQNLTYQLNDVAVGFASGQKPMTIFMQQGSQIAQIMAQAGVGVGGLVSQLGGMAVSFAAAHPVMVAVAVAAGVVASAIGLVTNEINKNSKVQVTWTDTVLGAWDMAKSYLDGTLTKAFEAFGTSTSEVWKWIVEATRTAVNFIIGAGTLAPRTLIAAFQTMPGAIADAFYTSVNFGIRAINGLVQRAVDALNGFANMVNPLLERVGLSVPKFGAPQIAELQNSYAGAARTAVNTFGKVLTDTWNRDYLGEGAKALSPFSQNRAKMREAAKKAGEDAGKAGGKVAGQAMAKAAADAFAADFAKFAESGMNGFLKNFAEMQETWAANDNEALRTTLEQLNENQIRRTQGAIEEAEARARNNEELAKTVTYLDDMIGLDGGLGRIFSAIKSGFGDAFSAIGKAFGGLRDSIGGLLAKLGSSFAKVAAGAAIGGFAGGAVGSSAGGAIGGGLGQIVGEKLFSKLGSFAGPLGAIAGGLLGGLIGGLFSGTKQASATLSSIGGQAAISGINGNNAQLKGVANSMATGLLKGLSGIAEQLGGQLGGAVSLSIGQRNKNFVVDPTGQGRTKGAGVINFGEDQAAAIAYATQLAIQQGIITGLSAGANALIKAGGDLQAQVEKAMKFDQVFKDLRAETDPLGAALDELTKEFDKLQVIFKEAGATAADYAALEELYAIKRRKAMMEADRPRRELEIQLMELSGNTAGALAAQRELELQAMDESLRPLQQQVYALQDQAKAAEEAARANEELANAQRLIADEVSSLQRQLLQEQGNFAAIREQDLAALLSDEARAIQQEIWNIQAAKEAAEKAAQAAERAEAERLAAAEEAARKIVEAQEKAAKITEQRQSMEIALLRAMGKESEALNAQRKLELASMDESLRGLQQQIWAAEDAAAARDVLRASYEREADTLRATAEKFRNLGTALRAFSADISRQMLGSTNLGGNLQRQFADTARLARLGNTDALERLPEVGRELASSVTANATDRVSMLRELSRINNEAIAAAGVADRQASVADRQLEALNRQVKHLISLEDKVVTVAEAINRLSAITALASGLPAPTTAAAVPSLVYDSTQNANAAESQGTRSEVAALREELKAALFAIAKNTAKTSDQLRRWDGDGMPEARNVA